MASKEEETISPPFWKMLRTVISTELAFSPLTRLIRFFFVETSKKASSAFGNTAVIKKQKGQLKFLDASGELWSHQFFK